jgi:hypothetical protein
MASPFPRLTPPQFTSPANLRFAYPDWQTFIYNWNVMSNSNMTLFEYKNKVLIDIYQ